MFLEKNKQTSDTRDNTTDLILLDGLYLSGKRQ